MARTSGGTPEAEGTVSHPAGWPDNRIGRTIQWIDYRLPIFTALRADLITYPAPANLVIPPYEFTSDTAIRIG